MKTMLELLIRLQQLRRYCERMAKNKQLTDEEKNSAVCLKCLVCECLPDEVLTHYDRLKEIEPELLDSPEVFAMAVLVSVFCHSSPAQRKRLLAWFPNGASPTPAMRRNRVDRSRGISLSQPRHRGLNVFRAP